MKSDLQNKQSQQPESTNRSLFAALGHDLSRKAWFLNAEKLCAEARRRTGLIDFGDPPLEPALTILVNSLENEARLHPLGRLLVRMHLRGMLEARLHLAKQWGKQSREVEPPAILRPLFISGMPRSGSTFLHELLSQEPALRAPRAWEAICPVSAA